MKLSKSKSAICSQQTQTMFNATLTPISFKLVEQGVYTPDWGGGMEGVLGYED